MKIKSDFIALLNTLQSVSGVTCSLWYSALLKNVLISLLGLGLGIVAFFNYLFSPFIGTFGGISTVCRVWIFNRHSQERTHDNIFIRWQFCIMCLNHFQILCKLLSRYFLYKESLDLLAPVAIFDGAYY